MKDGKKIIDINSLGENQNHQGEIFRQIRGSGNMYRVDIENKKLIKMPATTYSELNLRERFDIQEWIALTPEILGEPLIIISKELILPSGRRLDLLAVDKEGALVVIELKRDSSGSNVEWQAIKYASYCSSFSHDEIYKYFAEYLGENDDDAQVTI